MLVKPPMEQLLHKAENRYTLAILVAKRARQLVDGAQPLTESDSPNLVTIACEEIAADTVRLVRGHVNPHIQLRPEIEAARLAARNAAMNASSAEAIREELDQIAGSTGEDFDESDAKIIVDEIEKNIEAQNEAETTESATSDDLAETEE
ncbi:MAG: DNA-directed RNA polymerase subunit omega [Clostridia bacterium]|nr:DNA-directed RNA polymerase subunit omega [Clostridia bacterium]NCC76139.1 DNA-directed RNA polymerase subunit omega [Clostridia bacterium]